MKIRIGNDFEYAWVLENSEDSAPIDLNTAIGMTVTARVHRVRVNVPYDIVGNDTLLFKFNKNICSVVGDYNLELNYFSPDTSLAPKDREKLSILTLLLLCQEPHKRIMLSLLHLRVI